ncbi:hypothetical protein BRC2024_QFGIOCBO_CDS_0101 [Acinetobacter phage vB_AbaM_PhT2-v2]
MIAGYTIFYKDKDGFELPLTELGVFKIYPNERTAKTAMQELADSITNILHPIKTFKTKRTSFLGIKVVEEVEAPKLPEYARDELTRQLKTMFVKQVKVA